MTLADELKHFVGHAVPVVMLGAYAAVYRVEGTGSVMQSGGNLLLGLAVALAVQVHAKNAALPPAPESLFLPAACAVVVVASAILFDTYNPRESLASVTAQCRGLDSQTCSQFQQIYRSILNDGKDAEESDHTEKIVWVSVFATLAAGFLVILLVSRKTPSPAGEGKDASKGVPAGVVVAAYALALWVGWVHTATRRLTENNMAVQMVEYPGLQALFGSTARRMRGLHGYALAGGVAVVYALTRKEARGLETWMLYALVLGGFAVLASLYDMYAISERWQPLVAMVDPRAAQKNDMPHKGTVVLEGLGAMALALVLLCVAHKVRSPLWKTAEVLALALVFMLTLAFSPVSRMARDSPHLSKVGISPEQVDAFHDHVRGLLPLVLRPTTPAARGGAGR